MHHSCHIVYFDLSTVTNEELLEFIRIVWELMDTGKLVKLCSCSMIIKW